MYTVGGATKALCEVIAGLKAKGHEIVVCTSNRDSFNDFLDTLQIKNIAEGHISVMEVLPQEVAKNKLRVLYWDLKYRLALRRAIKKIEECIDVSSFDIIHTNSARNDIGCILHKKYNIPHVMHIREFGIEDFSCYIHRPNYYEYLNDHCNVFLAVSNAVRNSWISKGIDAKKAMTLYDGVDFSGFDVKNENKIINNKLKIIMVGGICETKGQDLAIKAISLLPDEIKRLVSLDLVGWHDPSFLDSIKEQIDTLKLNDQVNFVGSKENVADLLKNYNIGLMCSKCEGFGRVTVEYMFAGLGVIASNTGASPELIADKQNGLLFNRDNPNSLASRIEMYYRNPALLSACSKKAHYDAESRFSAQRNLNDILAVYKDIILK